PRQMLLVVHVVASRSGSRNFFENTPCAGAEGQHPPRQRGTLYSKSGTGQDKKAASSVSAMTKQNGCSGPVGLDKLASARVTESPVNLPSHTRSAPAAR